MQKLFYAVWTPKAEDIALEMCEEIEDEDKSLVERAEERAERFEGYSENRAKDADRAHKAVAAIADNIPLGQPILVGHHSERHARRDAKRIENGMRKAVDCWETSKYWQQRAHGAKMNAKYKERPDVRARRIKGLESELRKCLRNKEHSDALLKAWTAERLTLERARWIAGHTEHGNVTVCHGDQPHQSWSAYDVLRPDEDRYKACPSKTVEEVQAAVREHHARYIPTIERWIDHYSNRLEYEHAMLEEQGATVLLEKKAKSPAACLPLCNYRQPEGFEIENPWNRGQMIHYTQIDMTQAEYAKIYADYKGTRVVGKSHRIRTTVTQGANYKRGNYAVFITDSKVHVPPAPLDRIPVKHDPIAEQKDDIVHAAKQAYREEYRGTAAAPVKTLDELQAMRETLKAGVKVVSANQLFPTPAELARQVVEYAEIQKGQRILEPSAGTGNLLSAIWEERGERCDVAIEINPELCRLLTPRVPKVICADFLDIKPAREGNASLIVKDLPDAFYDRIIMNPPFEAGKDILHIQHAITFLKPGGRLVAICANGPRQQDKLKPIADHWEVLPAGSFKESGTMVNAAIMVYNKPMERESEPVGAVTAQAPAFKTQGSLF